MPVASPRVVMIALDSMDAALFDRFLAGGQLPNLERFAASAARVAVRSEGHLLHGTVWPTFFTGMPPGHHGIYFWNQWLAEEMRHVRNSDPAFATTPFWRALQPAGMTATLIDVPYVPAVAARGFRTASGWGLHDEMLEVSYPARLLPGIRRRYGRHPLQFDTVDEYRPERKLAMASDLARGTAMRARLLHDIAARRDANLLLVVFGEMHKALHYLAAPEVLAPGVTNEDAALTVLKPLDAAWPGIEEAAGEDAHIILFALHGIMEHHDYSFLGPLIVRLLAGDEPVDVAGRPDLIRRIRELLPDSVHNWLWRRLPAHVRAARFNRRTVGQWDFATDRLFTVVHDAHAGVRANLLGRERPGLVTHDEAVRLLDDLERLMGQLRTDQGQPAFRKLWRAEREQPGPRSHRLPDAMLQVNPAVTRTSRLIGPHGRVIHAQRPDARNGIHTDDGFALARGADALPAAATIDSLDFAPTVLGLLGVPPVTEIFGRDVRA